MNAPTKNGNGTNGQQKPTTAIQKMDPAQQQVMTFKDYLETRKANLAAVLPKHMSADRILKVAIASYAKTPELLKCDMASVYMAVRQACELGLEPGGALGHAYLIPYKGKCTLVPGYRGLIDLARRSGEIQSIEAHCVYENDSFDLRFGLDPKLEHVPNLDDPGKIRFVYAIAKLKDGGQQLEVMTKAQVDRIREASPGKNQDPWRVHYDEMARKTVVRRLIKYLPLSTEKARPLAEALEHDDMVSGPVIDLVAEEDGTRGQTRVAEVLAQAKVVEGEVVAAAAKEPERDPNTGEVVPPPPSDADAPPSGKVHIVDVA